MRQIAPPQEQGIAAHMLETAAAANTLLDAGADETIARFIKSQAAPGGGYHGRSPAPDIYYTAFAAQSLSALNLPPDINRLRAFVTRHLPPDHLGFVDAVSFAWVLSLAPSDDKLHPHIPSALRTIEQFRTEDGGYALEPSAQASTLYNAFLATLAYDSVDRRPPQTDRLIESLARFRRVDGGCANEADGNAATTTATAAAVSLSLRYDREVPGTSLDWLLGRRRDGGFVAGPAAPSPDLLSTATALYALRSSGVPLETIREAAFAFIESLWHESGGFRGSAADTVADCEYTFYGLLALGSLV